MNSDEVTNPCSKIVSTKLRDDEISVDSKYRAGSVVWAKVYGTPWAPAIISFCPINDAYYWFDNEATELTRYHVTFFTEMYGSRKTRKWVKSRFVKPFASNQDPEIALNPEFWAESLAARRREEQGAISLGKLYASQHSGND